MSVGKAIARYRKLRDFTQSELAEKLGVHQTQIVRWEKDRARPRDGYLEQIAGALGVTPDDLLYSDEEVEHVEDPELRALLLQVARLSDRQQEALKIFLGDMLKLSRFQEVMQS